MNKSKEMQGALWSQVQSQGPPPRCAHISRVLSAAAQPRSERIAASMVYADVMFGLARTVLLLLVLLMQSWGSAYAAKRAMLAVPTQTQTQEMPCHGQQAESKEQTAMPCCDADDQCTCTASCFTSGNAVAPRLVMGSDYTAPFFSKPASPGHLLPAHPLGLLRPPTRQES